MCKNESLEDPYFSSPDNFTEPSDGIRYNPETPEFSASTSLLSDMVQKHIDEVGADKVAIIYLGFGEVLQFFQSSATHDTLNDVRWFGPGSITKEHRLINDPIGLEFSTNVSFTTVQVGVSKNPTYEHVQEYLINTMGKTPNTFVHSSYDAVWLVGLSMLESQSSDASEIKKVMINVANSYSGAIGPVKLNEAGDLAQANYEVWGIRDGTWILLGQYNHSDDSITLS